MWKNMHTYSVVLLKKLWTLMSCAIYTLLAFYVALTSKPNDWLVRAMIVLATLCLVSAGFLVWNDEHKKAAKLEKEMESKTPFLRAVIHEALLVAEFNTADVFVDIEIFNERLGTEPSVRYYELSLCRDGKEYVSKTARNDVSKYQTCNVYDSYENGHLQFDYSDHSSLNVDLAAEISYDRPIKANAPRRGWLHFLIEGMPQWPSDEWPTGDVAYHPSYFDEDGELESEGGYVEKTVRIRDTKSAESVTLTIHYQGGKTSPCAAKIVHNGHKKVRKKPMQSVDESKLV